jgi:hypothetical protein
MSSLNCTTKQFKYSKELGRNFDTNDRNHFISNGKAAANYFNIPFSDPVEYQLYRLDDEQQLMQNSRMKTKNRYRSQETKTEIKYNEIMTVRCKTTLFKEIQPQLLSYICCCLNDNKFRHISFQTFTITSSPSKHHLSCYTSNAFESDQISDSDWLKQLLNDLINMLGIRSLNELCDGSGRKKRKQIFDDDHNQFKRNYVTSKHI